MYSVMYRKLGTSWIVIDRTDKSVICEIRGAVGVCMHPSGIPLHHGMYVHSFAFHRRCPNSVLLAFGVGESEEVLNQLISDQLAARILINNPKRLHMIMKACRN